MAKICEICNCYPLFSGWYYNRPETFVKMEIFCEQTHKKIKMLKTWRLNKIGTVKIINSKILQLPNEILCHIFMYLDDRSLRNASATCCRFFDSIRGTGKLAGNYLIIRWKYLLHLF